MEFISLMGDVIALAVIVLFAVLGWRKGMFKTMSGLLSVLVGIFVAKVIADYGSALIAEHLVPLFLPMVEEKLTAILTESAVGSDDAALGILALIPGVQDVMEGAAGAMAESLAPAIAREVAAAAAWIVLFVVGFVVAKLLCMLVMMLLNLIDNLPGLHFLNHAIGLVLGALKGFLLLLLILWAASWFDLLPEGLENTYLVRWLMGILGI